MKEDYSDRAWIEAQKERVRLSQQRMAAYNYRQPLSVTVQNGMPDPYRAQHSRGFDMVGVDEFQERLRQSGSGYAVVRSRQQTINKQVNHVLTDHQRVALALYCHGKTVGLGTPSLQRSGASMDGGSALDLTPSGGYRDVVLPDEFDVMCVGVAKFIDRNLTPHTQHLAIAIWRAACPQDTLPKVSWEHVAEHFTKSTDYKEKQGSLKTFLQTTSLEMSRLLQSFWRTYPPSEYCRTKIRVNVSEIFAL